METVIQSCDRADTFRVAELRGRVRAAMERPPVPWDCPARIDDGFMAEPLPVRKARAIDSVAAIQNLSGRVREPHRGQETQPAAVHPGCPGHQPPAQAPGPSGWKDDRNGTDPRLRLHRGWAALLGP
jgi:hypothetical protein